MNRNQLKYFVAAAESRSFTKAAEQFYISQTAITQQMQLLEESRNVDDADRRLLQIIHQQCLRTNGIVESVLGLARRERANPENLDLGAFVRRFVEDYRQTLSIETDSLEAIVPSQPVQSLVDPKHLQQILTALVHNAASSNLGQMLQRMRLKDGIEAFRKVVRTTFLGA